MGSQNRNMATYFIPSFTRHFLGQHRLKTIGSDVKMTRKLSGKFGVSFKGHLEVLNIFLGRPRTEFKAFRLASSLRGFLGPKRWKVCTYIQVDVFVHTWKEKPGENRHSVNRRAQAARDEERRNGQSRGEPRSKASDPKTGNRRPGSFTSVFLSSSVCLFFCFEFFFPACFLLLLAFSSGL